MAGEAIGALFRGRAGWGEFINQLYVIGVKSQSVVLITGAFTGMVLCAQTFFQFHKVKLDSATLAVVSVSMCGELGPVLTALMVAGRVGASMAAELGTMKVTEQIDAMRTLRTHPIDYLVAPRVAATLVALPLLTAESIGVGIASGFAVGVGLLNLDAAYSWLFVIQYTDPLDVYIGLTKAAVFGGIIAFIGCYRGLECGQGAEGVGRATTDTVVIASITVLITNFFLTLIASRFLFG